MNDLMIGVIRDGLAEHPKGRATVVESLITEEDANKAAKDLGCMVKKEDLVWTFSNKESKDESNT